MEWAAGFKTQKLRALTSIPIYKQEAESDGLTPDTEVLMRLVKPANIQDAQKVVEWVSREVIPRVTANPDSGSTGKKKAAASSAEQQAEPVGMNIDDSGSGAAGAGMREARAAEEKMRAKIQELELSNSALQLKLSEAAGSSPAEEQLRRQLLENERNKSALEMKLRDATSKEQAMKEQMAAAEKMCQEERATYQALQAAYEAAKAETAAQLEEERRAKAETAAKLEDERNAKAKAAAELEAERITNAKAAADLEAERKANAEAAAKLEAERKAHAEAAAKLLAMTAELEALQNELSTLRIRNGEPTPRNAQSAATDGIPASVTERVVHTVAAVGDVITGTVRLAARASANSLKRFIRTNRFRSSNDTTRMTGTRVFNAEEGELDQGNPKRARRIEPAQRQKVSHPLNDDDGELPSPDNHKRVRH